ncbi:hypothetical protein B0H66DRAFT_622506 [Apodospora peruviana]|uniref:SigF-like NTF2-like domain-containing protein n=1 Tax=Apodospora peruviana TaxID=516989 RepID=A0AAE0M439_9PEZI|nr:hypothetical protein B0H66DRAFT_622506 [Apodospora peruviana]
MEHPVKDVRHVIRALCQGTPEEQRDAVNRHFLPSASFVHPFCCVPSFEGVQLPFIGKVNSRMLVLAIFKWQPMYKILSPKIDLEIESSVFDQRAGLLYLTIAQTFSIWFIPFHKAPVRLVSVLQLVPSPSSSQQTCQNGQQINGNGPQHRNGNRTPVDGIIPSQHELNIPGDDEPSYAEVASGAAHPPPVSGSSSVGSGHSSGGGGQVTTHKRSSSGSSGPTRYMIKKQEDYYQVNEFLKFIFTLPGAYVWWVWQLFSTFMCVLGVIFLGPVMRILEGGRSQNIWSAGPSSSGSIGTTGGSGSNGAARTSSASTDALTSGASSGVDGIKVGVTGVAGDLNLFSRQSKKEE